MVHSNAYRARYNYFKEAMDVPLKEMLAAVELLSERTGSTTTIEAAALAGQHPVTAVFELISLGEWGLIRRNDDHSWSIPE
jgi:hypothetical protein